MSFPIKTLSRDAFAKFGTVVEFDPAKDPRFQVLVQETENVAWRVALQKVSVKSVDRLSCHPNTMETFEPVSGATVLLVAEHDSPEQPEFFLLDRPVCVNKSVWHNLIALSDSAMLKITENLTVRSEVHEFGAEIRLVAARS